MIAQPLADLLRLARKGAVEDYWDAKSVRDDLTASRIRGFVRDMTQQLGDQDPEAREVLADSGAVVRKAPRGATCSAPVAVRGRCGLPAVVEVCQGKALPITHHYCARHQGMAQEARG